jgi:hypothetical protein
MQAQEKNEQEKRISKKEVPAEVKSWLNDAYEVKRKVKWYYQTDGEKQVYEAKLKFKKQKHSVEIKPNGEVVNIEVEIDFDAIQIKAKQKIKNYYTAHYNKYNIKKVQIQYTGSNEDLEDLMDEDKLDDDIEINYEIVFYGKTETEDELWESLFDANGNLVLLRKIKLMATDNLDY